nr:serine hydrolase-like protein 2 [Meriones unguiculatus]
MPTPSTGSFLFSHQVGLWAEGRRQGGRGQAGPPTPLPPLSAADFCYVAMDFGGHGLSSHYNPGLPYYHQNFVSEVRRVATGSVVTLQFACIFPEMVDKLILLESTPFLLDSNEMENLLTYRRRNIEHTLQVEASQKSPRVFSQEEMLQGFLSNNSHLSKECGELLLQRGATKVGTGLVLNRDRRISLPENSFDFVSKELFVHSMGSLQANVLMIKAMQGYSGVRRVNDDDKGPLDFMVDTLRSVLKERFQYVEVPGNHYVHMNEPNLVAGVINSFLQSQAKMAPETPARL